MTCPHCGADLPPESVSCPGCGRAVAASVTASEPARSPNRRALMRWPLGKGMVIGIALAIPAFVLLFAVSANPNSSARARMSGVLLSLSWVGQTLRDQCEQGSLAPGVTDATPTDADRLYIRNITVRVDDPKRAIVIATLKDIYSELVPWSKSLDIPAGTTLVFQGQCEDRRFAWKLTETGVPNKYLPSNLRLPAN